MELKDDGSPFERPGEYEKLLRLLLTAESILRGIKHGALPAMPTGGYSLNQYVAILKDMGRAATVSGSAPERWLGSAIAKAKKRRARKRNVTAKGQAAKSSA